MRVSRLQQRSGCSSCLGILRELALLVMIAQCACGGYRGEIAANTSPSAMPVDVRVTLAPQYTEIRPGQTVAITARVSGTTDSAILWTVDDVVNGNARVGTLSASEDGLTVLYTAPDTPDRHLITAASLADPTNSATSVLLIIEPAPRQPGHLAGAHSFRTP